MKILLVIVCLLMSSCAGSILGFTPQQRDRIYAGAAILTGHVELLPVVAGVKAVRPSGK